MDYKILKSEHNNFDEVPNRFYLKCLSLKIRKEMKIHLKKHLFKI